MAGFHSRFTTKYNTHKLGTAVPAMHARERGFCGTRDVATGLGVMLVGKRADADEGGGAVASNDSGGELWTQGDHLHG